MKRFVLVTGSGKGLGLHVTKKHLEIGDQLYVLEHTITEELTALQHSFPTSLTVKQCDLGKTDEVTAAMQELADRVTSLDIIYNIAGIFFPSDRVPLVQTDIDRCMLLYNVNALGPLRVLKNAVSLLKSGTVVMNVTSESGSVGDCVRTAEYGYSMSKSAFNMASKIFSNQFAEKGVRIFCYHPGWMKTDMGGEGALLSPTSLSPEEAADAIMDITLHPAQIPPEVMYLDYQKNPLNW